MLEDVVSAAIKQAGDKANKEMETSRSNGNMFVLCFIISVSLL